MFSRPSGNQARLRALFLAVLVVGINACSDSGVDPDDDEGGSYTLELSPNPATVQELDSVKITATLRDGAGRVVTGRPVTWTSSRTSVATVNNGMVKGVGAGSAGIHATSEGTTMIADVTVTPVAVATLTFDPPSATLRVGQRVTLYGISKDAKGTVLPGRFVNNWSTNNTAVATVDGGIVTAVGPGVANISGTSGNARATAVITVNP
jgi:uncharacterized protein YjdB